MTQDPWEAFAAHVRAGEIFFQRCDECGTLRSVPSAVCYACGRAGSTWEPAPDASSAGAPAASRVRINLGGRTGRRPTTPEPRKSP